VVRIGVDFGIAGSRDSLGRRMPTFGTPNFFAYVALAAWLPLSLGLYWRLQPAVATAITVVLNA
jgi:hypothetical protein